MSKDELSKYEFEKQADIKIKFLNYFQENITTKAMGIY